MGNTSQKVWASPPDARAAVTVNDVMGMVIDEAAVASHR